LPKIETGILYVVSSGEKLIFMGFYFVKFEILYLLLYLTLNKILAACKCNYVFFEVVAKGKH
jgi:hypothetical protein